MTLKSRTLSVKMTVEIPTVPNFLKTEKDSVPLCAITDEGLRELGAAWIEALDCSGRSAASGRKHEMSRVPWSPAVMRAAPSLELMRVESVTPCRTINPKVIQFTISGYATTGERRQIQTINELRASLARESIKTLDQLVWVKWRDDPKYGKTLLKIEPDRTKYADSNS